jgi:basic membrane protein A
MYTKRWYGIVAALLVFTMLLTACAPTAVPAAPAATEATEGEAAAPASAIKIGLVTDVGRVNDRSFNQSAWDGVKASRRRVGIDEGDDFKYIETQDAKDYADNISSSSMPASLLSSPSVLRWAKQRPPRPRPIPTPISSVWINSRAQALPNLTGLVFA